MGEGRRLALNTHCSESGRVWQAPGSDSAPPGLALSPSQTIVC